MQLPKFRSILCLNGRLPEYKYFSQYNSLPLVCADGASNTIINMSLTPDLIVGDLDSLDLKKIPSECEILNRCDQNLTDFEKCLIEMDKRNWLPCLILGACGGEMDHSLYNLMCFMRESTRYKNIILDVDENNVAKWLIPLNNETFKINNMAMRKISIMPFPSARITTDGLRWDLTDETLSISTKSSVRNYVEKQDVTISSSIGSAIVMMEL